MDDAISGTLWSVSISEVQDPGKGRYYRVSLLAHDGELMKEVACPSFLQAERAMCRLAPVTAPKDWPPAHEMINWFSVYDDPDL